MRFLHAQITQRLEVLSAASEEAQAASKIQARIRGRAARRVLSEQRQQELQSRRAGAVAGTSPTSGRRRRTHPSGAEGQPDDVEWARTARESAAPVPETQPLHDIIVHRKLLAGVPPEYVGRAAPPGGARLQPGWPRPREYRLPISKQITYPRSLSCRLM